jgi:hypothetical protein
MTQPHGAPHDRYVEGAPLPQTDDPELRAAIDEYVRRHPGVSRSEAMNAILRSRPDMHYEETQQAKRDRVAHDALLTSLQSAIEDCSADELVPFVNEQIAAFNKFIVDGDEGENGVEIRKAA